MRRGHVRLLPELPSHRHRRGVRDERGHGRMGGRRLFLRQKNGEPLEPLRLCVTFRSERAVVGVALSSGGRRRHGLRPRRQRARADTPFLQRRSVGEGDKEEPCEGRGGHF